MSCEQTPDKIGINKNSQKLKLTFCRQRVLNMPLQCNFKMVFRAQKIDFIEDTAHMLLRILEEGNQRGEIDILTFSWWGARAKSGGGGFFVVRGGIWNPYSLM